MIPARRTVSRSIGPARFTRSTIRAIQNPDPALPPAQAGDFINPQNALVMAWNQYRIEVQGDVVTVNLNGANTSRYTNTDPNRGRFSAVEPAFIGSQSYSNYSFTTAFRNIRISVL